MRKLKLYLDTSVISYLFQKDSPEKEKYTNLFWEKARFGIYDIYLSEVTIRELEDCSEPKKTRMFESLSEIDFKVVYITDEIKILVDKIIDLRILTEKSRDDCYHISAAMVTSCDYLLSWNFKHLVNVKTINGVRAIASLNGYPAIDIITPQFLLGEN